MVYQGYLALVGVVLAMVQGGLALRCWKCSSDTDAICRDHFNTTRILLNQRFMDSRQYSNYPPARTDPLLVECDEMRTSISKEYKNICIKRVLTVPSRGNEVIRECRMVEKDFPQGECPSDVLNNNVIGQKTLEYCGSCEYDGCNSASTHQWVLMGLIPAVLLLVSK